MGGGASRSGGVMGDAVTQAGCHAPLGFGFMPRAILMYLDLALCLGDHLRADTPWKPI